MSDLKVLILTESLMPDRGSGRTGANIVAGLHKHGVQMTVFSEDISEREDGVQYKLLEPHRSSLFSFFRNIISVRRAVRTCDMVHALDLWPYGIYGYFAVLGTKKKLFINGIGTYSVAPLYRFGVRMLARLAYRRASSVFCISKYVYERIRELVPEANIEVVHLGATSLPRPSKNEIEKLKTRLHISNCTPLILTVGEIKHRKGQLETLKAISIIAKKYPRICYLMVGKSQDIHYRQQIENYAKEQGISIRRVSDIDNDEELAACYFLADVFALNSNNALHHFEGFGHVIIEAAQFGVPSVGSAGCGIEDAIREGYNGLHTPQGDAEDIADKLQEILVNREYFSGNAQEYATHFSWENTITHYISNYHAAVHT